MQAYREQFVKSLGLEDTTINWNLPPEELVKICLEKGQGALADNGALVVDTGEFTGRSPRDRFIVKDAITSDSVWWAAFNQPFDAQKFQGLYKKMLAYLKGKEIFVRDAIACADPRYRLKLRVINEYAWSNLFVYNMFIRPDEKEETDFTPDWLIINAPGFRANPKEDGTRQHNFSIIDFTAKIILVGGSAYTGEIKKGVFSALNFILPHQHHVLSMHCSANLGAKGDTAIFFGLSGTGKTTLSTDPERKLIGDDEHGWTEDNVVFNFEGGCYAKTIKLSAEREPEIFHAIRKGALLENVIFFPGSNKVDYANATRTENTRVSYPLDHIDNIARPSIGKNIRHIFFLTCDAYGVLPPISKLTPGQAAFYFISGYTAKVAGTEEGVVEPTMTFSACFGAPFMPMHPTVYADMLSRKMKAMQTQVWMVNTGWSGGPYGIGKRISLPHTRALINAAMRGDLDGVDYDQHEVFGLLFPVSCQGVPSEILDPKRTWTDKEAYDAKANFLAEAFLRNFEAFGSNASDEVWSGAPRRTKLENLS